MHRRHVAPVLGALLAALGLWACSDTNSSGNGSNTSCTGKFCIEEDRRIGVTPSSLVYADLAPGGDPQEIELRVRHDGNSGQLQLQSIAFDNYTDQFSVTNFVPATLDPGASVVWKVRYTPKAQGGKSLHLVIRNNATDKTRQNLPVPILVEKGGASLIVQPDPVDFLNVAAKATVAKTVKLINNGTQPMKFTEVLLSKSGSADFTITAMPKMDEAVAAGASQTMEVTYTPTGGDNDESSLSFLTDDGKKTIVPVRGNEIAPSIAVIPPTLNFGNMKLNDKATLPMKILSKGLAPLIIDKIEVADISLIKTITVTPNGAQTIESSKDLLLQVELTASQVMPNTGTPVANLIIYSNDPKYPNGLPVQVFAQTDTGSLMVTPSDIVDFAIVGKGKACTKATDLGCVKVQRKVELFNQGSAGLTIKSVELDADALGEFSLVPGNFLPVSLTPSSAVLDAGKGDYFMVQFVALGPTGGTAKTKLHIKSTDPQKPVWDLELVALRADGASCNIQLQPSLLNFGLIPYGEQKLIQLTLKNIGSGYCAFDHVNLAPCQGNGLPPPLGPGAITCKNAGTTLFKSFAPAAKLFNLAPGESGKLQVQFTAPADGGLFATPGEVAEYDGLIVAAFKDAATGLVANYPPVDFAKAGEVTAAKPNILAKVGKAAVQVMPGDVDFGIVSVGCKSPVQTVSVYNVGATDVYVTKVELQGCGPEVMPVQWPGIPKTGLAVSQSKPTAFGLQYGPQNTGKDQCQMLIYTGVSGSCVDANNVQTGKTCQASADCNAADWCMGTLFTVPLTGEGTLDTEFTDEFVQGTGKDVDVLFVVDNSPSMDNKQQNLASNLSTFVKIATLWSNNYHLGVITTAMDTTKENGKLQSDKNGDRILTPASPNATTSLEYLAHPGAGGSSDEEVFDATVAALSSPLSTNTSKSCAKDADCGGGQAFCVKGADDGKMFCGGYNRTFMRKNAGLEVIALTDEEEHGTGSLAYYENLFYSLKGLANKNLFHFHAITGDPGASGCTANGGAEDGSRLYQMTKDTGGKFGSICDSNYAQALKDIGSVAFGLAQQFFLTRTPEPSTLVVKVNGNVCTQASGSWTYDAASNSVAFNDKGSCMPQAGDKVSIYYKMLCFP